MARFSPSILITISSRLLQSPWLFFFPSMLIARLLFRPALPFVQSITRVPVRRPNLKLLHTSAMAPKEIRWGILATGGIAKSFAKDLTVDPTTRGVTDITHTIVAAASSTSSDRASAFLKEVDAPSTAKPYGSYAEFVKDPSIDIVYVATPHSHHYQNAMLCLNAGKNVLCEKAFTVNAAQARKLVETAKAKDLFLMEAVWTRYFPLATYVRETMSSGKLGTVVRTIADLSMAMSPQDLSDSDRVIDPKLAGGALLDIGVYALTWAFFSLYNPQPPTTRQKPRVQSTVKAFEKTGVDEMTSMLLTFPRSSEEGGDAHAVATCSMHVRTDPDQKGTAGPAVRIQGTKGEVQVFFPTFRPTRARTVLHDGTVEDKEFPQPGPGEGSGWYNGLGRAKDPEGQGHGMFWEADEAARGLVEGRKEGGRLGWEESVTIMEVMDEVRKQNGLVYPDSIETTELES